MKRRLLTALLPLLVSATALHAGEVGISLKGSRASMERQNQIALGLDYSFLRSDAQVEKLAGAGLLVPVLGNEHYRVLASRAVARPVVRDFVERLAADYVAGCGELLVVTSLTRPTGAQPRNASPLSVHPAGMAVDLRVSRSSACVDWLEAELLALEQRGLIDATREYHPPHFHIAVFPEAFEAYQTGLVADSSARAAQQLREREARVLAAAHLAILAPAPGTAGGWSGVGVAAGALLSLLAAIFPF